MTPQSRRPKTNFIFKECTRCGGNYGIESFTPTNSFFYHDHYLPICNDCIESFLIDEGFGWSAVDKLCQFADLPFVPKEFERLYEENGTKVFPIYAKIFAAKEYEGLGWDDYFKRFKELKASKEIEDELPLLSEEKYQKLRERWGANYDEEALIYLENLYQGLTATQNVASALQIDQALKVCKLSYEIDSRIREGSDFDKILASYDKLVKTADFTPKAAKNSGEFESFGEVARWLEKRGWRAKYYDNVTKDIVDETLHNIQSWNQRLYTDESSIGDEITHRLEALKRASKLERGVINDDELLYTDHIMTNDESDRYENDGYDRLFVDENFEEDFE